MNLNEEEKEFASNSIITNAQLDLSFLTLNGIATMVACSGLMANSTAVIIGSMLIATLLSPIAGTALAISNSNKNAAISSLKTLSIGVVLVICIAFVYGLAFPKIEATDRMLARTEPGIFDFFIAFFGGLAGGIALLFKRYSSIMIGVGIATALVPPLSTAGIFFSKGSFILGLRAFELAAINILFIMIANYIVFRYFKIPHKTIS